MSPENKDNSSYQNFVQYIKRISGEKPDLFTPAILRELLNQECCSAILEGFVPGSIGRDETSGQLVFRALFTPSELNQFRSALLGPLAPPIQISVDTENDKPPVWTIESLGDPLAEEIILPVTPNTSVVKTRYRATANQTEPPKS